MWKGWFVGQKEIFGKMDMDGIFVKVVVNGIFGKMDVDGIFGKVDVDGIFGKVVVDGIFGKAVVNGIFVGMVVDEISEMVVGWRGETLESVGGGEMWVEGCAKMVLDEDGRKVVVG